jgi:hypothetical protein
MSEISFIYNIPPVSIGGFQIDAFIKEGYKFGNTVTDIPMEDGSHASDHVVENAAEITIDGFIGGVEFAVWTGSIESLSAGSSRDPKDMIRAAYLELMHLKSERQPVDLVTGLDTYPNMVITSFEIDRDASNGNDLPFTMTFKQIRVIKSETTAINYQSAAPYADQIAPAKNKGIVGKAIDFMQEQWRLATGKGLCTKEEYNKTCVKKGWTP